MTSFAKLTLHERIERFIARRELIAPHQHVVWSDPHDHAVVLRLDDLRELIALIPPTPIQEDPTP